MLCNIRTRVNIISNSMALTVLKPSYKRELLNDISNSNAALLFRKCGKLFKKILSYSKAKKKNCLVVLDRPPLFFDFFYFYLFFFLNFWPFQKLNLPLYIAKLEFISLLNSFRLRFPSSFLFCSVQTRPVWLQFDQSYTSILRTLHPVCAIKWLGCVQVHAKIFLLKIAVWKKIIFFKKFYFKFVLIVL